MEYAKRRNVIQATMTAVESIEHYEFMQLMKKLFIYQFTGVWSASHPQIRI